MVLQVKGSGSATLTFLPEFDNINERNAYNAKIGDVAFVTGQAQGAQWTGSSWIQFTGTQGPQGVRGLKGEPGEDGIGGGIDFDSLNEITTTPLDSKVVIESPDGNTLSKITITNFLNSTLGAYLNPQEPAVNTVPVAVNSAATVGRGDTLNGSVSATDVDGDPLTYALVSDVSVGTLTFNANGTYSYVHDGGATLSDSFTYRANDGTGNSNTATVSLTITNASPVATGESFTLEESATLNAALTGNDTDADGDTLTYIKVTDPANGTLTINSNGAFTYVNDGTVGADSFTYKVNDGVADSAPVTVTLTVEAVNSDAVTSTPDQRGDYYAAPLATFQTAIAGLPIDAIYDLGAPTEAQALVNIANPGTFDATKVGTVVHRQGIGMSSDSTTGYLDCNVSPVTAPNYTQNSGSIHLFNTGGLGSRYMVGTASGTNSNLSVLNNDGVVGSVNSGSWVVTGLATNAEKLYSFASVSRLSSTAATVYLDGTLLREITNSNSTALSASNFNIFRVNGTFTTTGQIVRMVIIAGGLDQSQITTLYNAVRDFVDATGERRFILMTGGQSNMQQIFSAEHSGNNTFGTDAGTRILKPFIEAAIAAEYNDGRPNKIAIVDKASGGSSVMGTNATVETDKRWWNGEADTPYLLLTAWENAYNSIWNPKERAIAEKQVAWAQGEADVGKDMAEWKLSTQQIFAYMRGVTGQADMPIVIHPIGKNSDSTTGIDALRIKQSEIAAEDNNVYLGADTFDIVRLNSQDWHAVNDFAQGNNPAIGYDRMAEYVARAAAHQFGCDTVYYQGALPVSAQSVDETTVDVTISYPPSIASGRDFVPETAIGGFRVKDANGVITVTAAVRVNSTKVRLTLNSALGASPQWSFNPNITGLTGSPRDNAAFPMPFQFVDYKDVSAGGGGTLTEGNSAYSEGNSNYVI